MKTIARKEIVINGNSYDLEHLTARRGIAVLVKLIKILGEPFAHLMSVHQGGLTDLLKAHLSAEQLGEVVTVLASKLEEEDLCKIIDELFRGSLRNGKDWKWDIELHDSYRELFELLKGALEFNYGSFFGSSPTASEP